MFNFIESFYSLLTQDYWRDELFTIFLARNDFLEIIKLTANDFNPPLYYFLTHIWINLFGESPIYLRTLPILGHLLAVVMGYKLARIFTSKINSFLFAIILLTNGYLFSYSFELRPYSFVVFFAVASTYAMLKKKNWLMIFFNVLGLYTHTYFVFFVFFQGLYLLWQELEYYKDTNIFKIKKQVFLSLRPTIISYLFFIPWLPTFIFQYSQKQADFWLSKNDLIDVVKAIAIYISGYSNAQPFITFTSLSVFVFALVFVFNNKKSRTKELFLFFGIFPTLFAVFVSHFSPVFTDRYLIFTVPFLLIIFVDFLDLNLKEVHRSLKILLVLALIIGYVFFNIYQFSSTTHDKYGYKAHLVVKDLEVRPKTIITNIPIHYFGFKYYFEKEGIYDVKFFNVNGKFPHFVGDAVVAKNDIITTYVNESDYIFIGDDGLE